MTVFDTVGRLRAAIGSTPRSALGVLPTPLTPLNLEDGTRIWIKRDDLLGPGLGGNKIRKLEFLVADAQAKGADRLLTVGSAQSNHARLTAAAGAIVGVPTHLTLGGVRPTVPHGNQLLGRLFGATMHFPGTDDWGALEVAQEKLADDLRGDGYHPYVIPVGGSTPVGAIGFAAAYDELLQQCSAMQISPQVVIHASSSGGTHAGLLAGEACYRADGYEVPNLLAISVAKTANDLHTVAFELASSTLSLLGMPEVPVEESSIQVDGRWLGDKYAAPTTLGDAALIKAARLGAILLDRVYTAKAFAGLLGNLAEGRWDRGSDIVFWHTGGQPAVFAPDGCPIPSDGRTEQSSNPIVKSRTQKIRRTS